ncbi:MAG: PLP-dependent aminotransferase family protein [Thermoplasmata archaeon]|nr:PLP-dependent aminotransferase family protein [Thermoplasmata archaeon]
MDVDSKFSDISKILKGSAVRELLKYAEQPDVISFGGGMPNPLSFPIKDIEDIVHYIFENNGAKALQYGSTEGVEELRDLISKRLKSKYNINGKKENIIMLNGSQSGLYMVSKVFLNRKDYVISEAPTYVGAIAAFNAQDPTWLAIDLQKDGMNMEELEDKIKFAMKEKKTPKFIYVIPTFQNPAGLTWSLDKRKHLLELANKYDLIIFEDDPYSEIRFSGEPLPPIKSFDTEDRVIYMGTFSKVLSPGIRLGYVLANDQIIRKIALLKQGVDLCTNVLSQYLAIEYLKRGIIDKQVPKIVELYRKKRDIMLDSLEKYMPKDTTWTRPDGGMFLWVTVNEKIDTTKLLQKALENKVAYVVGTGFYPDGRGKNSMRLNFTYSKDEDIVEGIKRLGNVIKKEIS